MIISSIIIRVNVFIRQQRHSYLPLCEFLVADLAVQYPQATLVVTLVGEEMKVYSMFNL